VQIHGRFDDLRYKEIGGGFGYTLTPLDDGRVVSYMVMDDSPAAKAEYNPAQRSWLWTASQSRTRRLRYPFSGRENPCLPQPSAALNNATNRFKQQMSITLFSKAL
jgi:hypothetical protein